MCSYVFSSTLSPSCSNYALRRTAAYNEKQFGSEGSDTLRRNFYLNDLLKSVKTIKETVILIINVAGMCAAGGSNLTKFTSNTKKVLMTIPEAKSRKRLKNQDLVSGVIPQEKKLGINWNVEGNNSEFQAQHKMWFIVHAKFSL